VWVVTLAFVTIFVIVVSLGRVVIWCVLSTLPVFSLWRHHRHPLGRESYLTKCTSWQLRTNIQWSLGCPSKVYPRSRFLPDVSGRAVKLVPPSEILLPGLILCQDATLKVGKSYQGLVISDENSLILPWVYGIGRQAEDPSVRWVLHHQWHIAGDHNALVLDGHGDLVVLQPVNQIFPSIVFSTSRGGLNISGNFSSKTDAPKHLCPRCAWYTIWWLLRVSHKSQLDPELCTSGRWACFDLSRSLSCVGGVDGSG
jgi:hypothetical protein